MSKPIKKKMSPTLTISLGYFIIVALGTVLLMLPFSTRSGSSAGIETALFTATSATCVTGLIIEDTFTYWSYFGQAVILCLIQIGGIGFMTLAISAVTLTKKKISLRERNTLKESFNASAIGGVVKMSRFILAGTAIVELFGTLVLMTRFCPRFGFLKGLYFSVFHSVSAFCNAGFDLMGENGAFSSLTPFADDVIVNLIIMFLITVGGLGFFVWSDLIKTRFSFKKMKLHTKIVLTSSAVLVLGSFFLIMLFERSGEIFDGKTQAQQVIYSLFQAVTPRTAGFNTVNLSKLTDSTIILTIFLMLIGGSPSSTAGGLKTTTLAVVFLSIPAVLGRKKNIEVFNRRIENSVLIHILCLVALYTGIFLFAGMFISSLDGVTLKEALFEAASAVGTVGLTLGITSTLSGFSHLILICLMFFGRVGGLTLLLSLSENRNVGNSTMPAENITIG